MRVSPHTAEASASGSRRPLFSVAVRRHHWWTDGFCLRMPSGGRLTALTPGRVLPELGEQRVVSFSRFWRACGGGLSVFLAGGEVRLETSTSRNELRPFLAAEQGAGLGDDNRLSPESVTLWIAPRAGKDRVRCRAGDRRHVLSNHGGVAATHVSFRGAAMLRAPIRAHYGWCMSSSITTVHPPKITRTRIAVNRGHRLNRAQTHLLYQWPK